MLYDVRLELHYDYLASVHGDRHLVRVTPPTIPGVQRVIAASLRFDPKPQQESTFTDFFGNHITTIAYQGTHRHLDVRLAARVQVEEQQPPADLSPAHAALQKEIGGLWTLEAGAPHHFLSASSRIPLDPAITAYAMKSVDRTLSVQAAAMDLCLAIHRDFKYDKDATRVDTGPSEAFALKRGVRTIPPKGKPRLAGADAMHAWVRVWCGKHAGWLEFDPTNAMRAGPDHITIGHGRDYADISPIVGVLRTSGDHRAKQSVDVIRVE